MSVYVCISVYSLESRYIRYNVDDQRLNPLQVRYIAATHPLHFWLLAIFVKFFDRNVPRVVPTMPTEPKFGT